VTPDDGIRRVPCHRCRRFFGPAYPSQRLCRICLHEDEGKPDLALAEIAWERGYALGLERGRRNEPTDIEAALGALPLIELLQLCHPDRHPPERFEQANRISVWLNGLRDSR
jgi:hypothetical protein